MSVHISTTRNLLNWPQNTDLSDYQILNRVNAIATDDDGSDLTNAIKVDANNVNWHRLKPKTIQKMVNYWFNRLAINFTRFWTQFMPT